mmetsp:Transcript_28704/g.68253  ORF Transcript_28704/g.68253 Transcript_28704/m.68253 type:complete len:202 (-) Transcript_28704:80-685(-)
MAARACRYRPSRPLTSRCGTCSASCAGSRSTRCSEARPRSGCRCTAPPRGPTSLSSWASAVPRSRARTAPPMATRASARTWLSSQRGGRRSGPTSLSLSIATWRSACPTPSGWATRWPHTASSGWRSSCRPTTTKATRRCVVPYEAQAYSVRRANTSTRATASAASSPTVRWTSCSRTSPGAEASRRRGASSRRRLRMTFP